MKFAKKKEVLTKYKLLVSDIDDTIVIPGNKLSPINIKAIEETTKHGIEFAVASGKPTESIRSLLINSGLSEKFVNGKLIIIGYNGAEAWKGNKKLYSLPLQSNIANNVIDFCVSLKQKAKINAAYFTSIDFNMLYENILSELYKDKLDYKKVTFPERNKIDYKNILKIVIMSPYNNNLLTDEIISHLKRMSNSVKSVNDKISPIKIFRAKPHFLDTENPCEWIEIMADNIDKGYAVEKLAEHYGYNLNEIICIGDGINDLEMLQIPEVLSIVVNNSRYPEVRDVADHIVNSVDHEKMPGFAQTVYGILLR